MGRWGRCSCAVGALVVAASSCSSPRTHGPATSIAPGDADVPVVTATGDADVPAVPVVTATGDAGVPAVPIGFDAFRSWDQWPRLRIGTRTYMRSTYDRAGGNEGADASHFLRVTSDRATPLDVVGPGVLTFERYNHWHGSPWHYVVDGTDYTVQETDTATPGAATPGSSFIPSASFPAPLAWTWSTTQGADLVSVPMAFTQSLRLDYERTFYGTGYFIYQAFPQGAENLSAPLTSWAGESPPQDVLDLVGSAGQDIAPAGRDVAFLSGTVSLPAGSAITVFDATGPASVRAFVLSAPVADAQALGAAHLRITWDDRATPSIDAPVALFFGTGSLFNRSSREFLVKAFPVSVRFASQVVSLAAYFPMPFARHAHVELVGADASVAAVTWQARTQPYAGPPNWVGYLHATYVDQGTPQPGVDLTLLDTTKVEGGGDWCGSFVGTSFTFSDRAVLQTLEGDPRMFFDDSQTPQVQGTGTEEWGGGGDYWSGGMTTTLPFYGHPVGAPNPASALGAEDQIESAYRFLLSDLVPFGKNARIQLEHGGVDESTEHYRTLAYWYGLPGACLVQTDALHVGDVADEKAHDYSSPTAAGIDTLDTRYEWGVDHVGATEIYPSTQDTGRHMTGTTEFTVSVQPKNFGVLLRRKLDYGYPDQAAEVFVADASVPSAPFASAGTWYLAGSNACVYSSPLSETGPITPSVEVSNRRWRDDEFLLPRSLTDGKSALRIRIVFQPRNLPLMPGATPTAAWSEFRYTAYVWTLPPAP